jgi:hypothetical protein
VSTVNFRIEFLIVAGQKFSRTQEEIRIGSGITYSTNPANSSLSAVAEMDTVLSGMFSFHIPSGTWQKICDDLGVPFLSGHRNSPIIRARVGHSMLFHHVSCRLHLSVILNLTA